MRIRSFGLSDVGRRREKNEDSFLVSEELKLYAVADGMGGHLGGDFASRMAVETLDETLKALEADPESTLREGDSNFRPGEYQGYLRYAIGLGSQRIFERATAEATLHGMGTTTVALLFRNNKVYVANVGDSRAYRIRRDKITQITKDHSLVGEQIRAGMLSADDARVHRLKNIITRSVGFQEDVEADIDIRVVREGDRFLLCSDGLSNMIEDSEIRDIVATNDLEAACHRLIDIANERGGDDNITAVLVEVEALEEEDVGHDPSDESTIEL
ncbi:MAG: Stp1/IreP family PP2C-type Ser/Thr phosphatase [Pseudomonadota bacterium]